MPAGRMGVLLAALVFFPAGQALGAFHLFDDFEDEVVGPIVAQDNWRSVGGDNRVAADPEDAANQVVYIPSSSSVLSKSLLLENVAVPNGSTRMLFLRIRVANKQTFSVGISNLSMPSEFSDFAPEVGMANSAQNLDLRVWDDDGANYEMLVQLLPDTWYNMWIRVDALNDNYQIWLNDAPGNSAFASDKLAAADGDETFDFRSGLASNLITFYVKTAGGSSGQNFGPVYLDDIYLEQTEALNLSNPTNPADFDGDGDVDGADYGIFAGCFNGTGNPVSEACLPADLNGDQCVDGIDYGLFGGCFNGSGNLSNC